MDEKGNSLREKAKDELRRKGIIDQTYFETDLKALIEELSIYQIELEHQNQELISSQERLEQTKNRYLDLFDNAPIGYIIVDANCLIKVFNQTACDLLEISKDELNHTKITKYIHPDFQDDFYLYFRALVKQEWCTFCDIQIQKPNKEFFFARVQGNRETKNKSGDVEFRLALIDITVQKDLEFRLIAESARAIESDKLKTIFLANMSHEIRTPMNGILGFTELIKNSSLSAETRLDYIKIIEKCSNRLLILINELIDISKIEAGQMQIKLNPTSVTELINEVSTFFQPEAEQKNIALRFELNQCDPLQMVETDKDKLYDILSNLIKNAIKYTRQGEIIIGFYPIENNLKFYVKDTGIGIPKEKYDIIFQRFRQVEEYNYRQGTGLGLSIVKGLVELLGGNINFKSIVNKGSIFYFTVPYKEIPPIKITPLPANEAHQPNLSEKTIVVAEDDFYSYFYISELLKKTNATIHHAENGIQLMDFLKTKTPDLILLDINMPLKTGSECLKELKTKKIRSKIIVLTAYAMEEEKQSFLGLGSDGYLSKPCKKNDLFNEITRVMPDLT